LQIKAKRIIWSCGSWGGFLCLLLSWDVEVIYTNFYLIKVVTWQLYLSICSGQGRRQKNFQESQWNY